MRCFCYCLVKSRFLALGDCLGFEEAMCGRHTPPCPSQEGRFGRLLLIGNGWVVWGGFPSREGIKGCVMERGAGWVEMILLLFGDVVFLGFGWLLWV